MGNIVKICGKLDIWECLFDQAPFDAATSNYLLPPMGADPDSITFSGINNGADMSVTMHVIFSYTI